MQSPVCFGIYIYLHARWRLVFMWERFVGGDSAGR